MVRIEDSKGKKQFYVNQKNYDLLERCKAKINKEDSEVWAVFYGETGSGKSLKAMRWAYAIDPTLSLDRICFDKDEFVKAIIKAKKGQAIIIDEAISLFFSRAAMVRDNRILVELANQVRQKNLCVFLCIPDILALDKLIQNKLNFAVKVYEGERDGKRVKGSSTTFVNTKRRRYVERLIRSLLLRRSNPFKKIKPTKYYATEEGNCIDKRKKVWYPVPEEEYRAKKESILEKYLEKKENPQTSRDRNTINNVLVHLRNEQGLSYGEIAKITNHAKSTIVERLKNLENKGFGSCGGLHNIQ